MNEYEYVCVGGKHDGATDAVDYLGIRLRFPDGWIYALTQDEQDGKRVFVPHLIESADNHLVPA